MRADYGEEAPWERTPQRRWRGRHEQLDERRRPHNTPGSRDDYSGDYGSRQMHERGGGKRLMHWDSLNQGGDYYGAGGYHGAYSTQPGARASSEIGEPGRFGDDWIRTWDEPGDENVYRTSGDYDMYGRAPFGAQSGYRRPIGPAQGTQRGYGQDYRERFAEARYGREPGYGYGFEQRPYESETGHFRGRGPKGYERSDERLREIICERLTDEPSVDASDVSIDVKDKIVKLTGSVPDRRTKYEIEELVERCGGVKDMENHIRVRRG